MEQLFAQVDWRCSRCGAKAGTCGCIEKCSCGWLNVAGDFCQNPATTRCTSKIKYGRYNRSTKRYEPKMYIYESNGRKGKLLYGWQLVFRIDAPTDQFGTWEIVQGLRPNETVVWSMPWSEGETISAPPPELLAALRRAKRLEKKRARP